MGDSNTDGKPAAYDAQTLARAAEEDIMDLVEKVRLRQQDPDVALDMPSWVCYTVVIDSFHMFEDLIGRSPAKVNLPRTVEILLDAYAAKHCRTKNSLRKSTRLLGAEVVFDAPTFKLE